MDTNLEPDPVAELHNDMLVVAEYWELRLKLHNSRETNMT
jgi:hypothetical protein